MGHWRAGREGHTEGRMQTWGIEHRQRGIQKDVELWLGCRWKGYKGKQGSGSVVRAHCEGV